MRFPFSIVIPTYNEAGGIERLLRALDQTFKSHGLDGEIIVVDDNSPDGTGAIVDALSSELPVRCLHRPGKLGLSSGVIDGWRVARPESEALGAMDADFSHDINALPKMVEALESGRVRVGSRQPIRRGRRYRELAEASHHYVARRVLARASAHARQRCHERLFSRATRCARRRHARSDRLQDRTRGDREGALRGSDRSTIRLHRPGCRRVEAQPARDTSTISNS